MSDPDDERWMALATSLARLAPPSPAAYSVGAVILNAAGTEVSRGFSREDGDPHVHAEESALGKLAPGDQVAGGTLYSTLEPCTKRMSRARSCTELILATGIARVVIAWREPDLFVADCVGVELLQRAGVAITELPGFAAAAKAPNQHLNV